MYRVVVEIADYESASVRRIKNALWKHCGVQDITVSDGMIVGEGEENQSGSEEDVAADISFAVWKANRGYCRVSVREIDLHGNDYELAEGDYAEMVAKGLLSANTYKRRDSLETTSDDPILPAPLQARLDRVGEMLSAERDWPAVIARMDRSTNEANVFASERRAGDLAVAYGSWDLLGIPIRSAMDQIAPLWERLDPDQHKQVETAAIRLAQAIFLDPTVDAQAYAVLTEPFVADFPALANPDPWV